MLDVTQAIWDWMVENCGHKQLLLEKKGSNEPFQSEFAENLSEQFYYDSILNKDESVTLGAYIDRRSNVKLESEGKFLVKNINYCHFEYIPVMQDTDIISLYVDHISYRFWFAVKNFQKENGECPLLNVEVMPFFQMYAQDVYSHERFHRLVSLTRYLYNHTDKVKAEKNVSEGLAGAFAYHTLMVLSKKPTHAVRKLSRSRMEQFAEFIAGRADRLEVYKHWRDYIEPNKFMWETERFLHINTREIVFGKWTSTNMKDFILNIEPWLNWDVLNRTKFIVKQSEKEVAFPFKEKTVW